MSSRLVRLRCFDWLLIIASSLHCTHVLINEQSCTDSMVSPTPVGVAHNHGPLWHLSHIDMERLLGWSCEQTEYMCCQCQSCANCSSVHVFSLSNFKDQRCDQSSVRQVFHAIVTVHATRVVHVVVYDPVLAFIFIIELLVDVVVIFVSLHPEVHHLIFLYKNNSYFVQGAQCSLRVMAVHAPAVNRQPHYCLVCCIYSSSQVVPWGAALYNYTRYKFVSG
jgi:hypothetical protein